MYPLRGYTCYILMNKVKALTLFLFSLVLLASCREHSAGPSYSGARTGRVIDVYTGQPVSEILVSAQTSMESQPNSGTTEVDLTDENGKYTLLFEHVSEYDGVAITVPAQVEQVGDSFTTPYLQETVLLAPDEFAGQADVMLKQAGVVHLRLPAGTNNGMPHTLTINRQKLVLNPPFGDDMMLYLPPGQKYTFTLTDNLGNQVGSTTVVVDDRRLSSSTFEPIVVRL